MARWALTGKTWRIQVRLSLSPSMERASMRLRVKPPTPRTTRSIEETGYASQAADYSFGVVSAPATRTALPFHPLQCFRKANGVHTIERPATATVKSWAAQRRDPFMQAEGLALIPSLGDLLIKLPPIHAIRRSLQGTASKAQHPRHSRDQHSRIPSQLRHAPRIVRWPQQQDQAPVPGCCCRREEAHDACVRVIGR